MSRFDFALDFTVSNFGNKNAAVKKHVKDLLTRGIVDEAVLYSPSTFTGPQKKELVCPRATGMDLGAITLFLVNHVTASETLWRL